MVRTLFTVFNIPVPSYIFFNFLAFISFYIVLSHQARRDPSISRRILLIYFLVLFSATIGSRLFYGLFHPSIFKGNLLNIFSNNVRGFSMAGGLLLVLFIVIIYCRITRISLRKLLDMMAPAFGLGLFFSRLACFFNGCCFGKPFPFNWKILVYPEFSPPWWTHETHGQALHPTQLYEALGGLAIFMITILAERKPKPDGFLFIILCWIYGPVRFITDFFRYNPDPDPPPLQLSQYFSIFIFIFGFILLGYLYSERKKKAAEGDRLTGSSYNLD